jgi:hypothetical protein
MRESRTYGSVRGAGSNLRPYRDRPKRRRKGDSYLGVNRKWPDIVAPRHKRIGSDNVSSRNQFLGSDNFHSRN